jgi:hypothetical protein
MLKNKTKKESRLIIFLGGIVVLLMVFFVKIKVTTLKNHKNMNEKSLVNIVKRDKAVKGDVLFQNNKAFQDNFSEKKTLVESSTILESKDKDWWLNSGAIFKVEDGIGKTLFGNLNKDDYWRKNYVDYNSDETSQGYRPQNLFRLVTKTRWQNFRQEAYFRIKYYEKSSSKHRSGSNGIFLFNRYQDGDNLYYTGLRVDGTVIVKKKYKGEYYTIMSKKVLSGKYNRQANPILIPLDKWIGLRSEVITKKDRVFIRVFLDRGHDGNWQEIFQAVDDGKKYGNPIIFQAGYAGLRTDFMDCEFDDYAIIESSQNN